MTAAPKSVLAFDEIPRLPDSWWTDKPVSDPPVVWTVWKHDTVYLWGANSGNYNRESDIGTLIGGGGMAGTHGPTRGRNHPHYVGIITMNSADMPLNAPVYADLVSQAKAGRSVTVPVFPDPALSPTGYKFSLGTGIGGSQPGWGDIQTDVLNGLIAIGKASSGFHAPAGTYWPDLREAKPTLYPIRQLSDLQHIVDNVLSKAPAAAG